MEQKKVAVFIDAGNLWSSYKKMGKLLDFPKLSDFIADKFESSIFKVFYNSTAKPPALAGG